MCEQRPDFIGGAGGGLSAAWEALVGASGSANSAARRFRLRCLKAVVLLLLDEKTEIDALLSAPADNDGASPNERRQQVCSCTTPTAKHVCASASNSQWSEIMLTMLTIAKRCRQAIICMLTPDLQCLILNPPSPALQLVAQLVAEIILCCKEVNTKTRATAFELLVEVGHAMHAARPPPAMPPLDDAMGTQPCSPTLSAACVAMKPACISRMRCKTRPACWF